MNFLRVAAPAYMKNKVAVRSIRHLVFFCTAIILYEYVLFRLEDRKQFPSSPTLLSSIRFSTHKKRLYKYRPQNEIGIPVYVVTAKRWGRRQELMRKSLEKAGFVGKPIFRSKYDFTEVCSGRFAEMIKDKFRFPTSKYEEEDALFCEDVLAATAGVDPAHYCRNNNTLDCRFIAIAMEHMDIIEDFANQTDHSHALILEDDQIVWELAADKLALLLKLRPNVDMFMLDDSFCFNPSFYPPMAAFQRSFISGITSYPRNASRTTGAYAISLLGAKKLSISKGWAPQITSVDWQLNYAIQTEPGLQTHWVYPPLTCHGSQQEETKMERVKSIHCCENHWYN